MIRHVVVFRWKPDITDETIDAVRAALTELPARVPGIVSYEFGADAGINEGNFDFAVVAEFDDRDDYVVYRDHPAHRALIADLVAPHVAERAAVQLER